MRSLNGRTFALGLGAGRPGMRVVSLAPRRASKQRLLELLATYKGQCVVPAAQNLPGGLWRKPNLVKGASISVYSEYVRSTHTHPDRALFSKEKCVDLERCQCACAMNGSFWKDHTV